MDLPGLLASGDLENFKYYYLFFRREAFGRTVDGGSFLGMVREGSVAYVQEIGEDLQENVYRAMKILAQGFLRKQEMILPPPSRLSAMCRRTACGCSIACCSYSMQRAAACWMLRTDITMSFLCSF